MGKQTAGRRRAGDMRRKADTGPRKTMKLYISDGTVWEAVAAVWDDISGHYRAYWVEEPNGKIGCPVIGFASPGGAHKTIKGVVEEFKKMYPNESIFRNGKRLA